MTFAAVPILGWGDQPVRALVVDFATGSAQVILAPEEPPIELRLEGNGSQLDEEQLIEAAVVAACASTTELRVAPGPYPRADSLLKALEVVDLALAPDGLVQRTDLDPYEMSRLRDVERGLKDLGARLSKLSRTRIDDAIAAFEDCQSQAQRVAAQVQELLHRPLRPRSHEDAARPKWVTALTPLHVLRFPQDVVEDLHMQDLYTVGDILALPTKPEGAHLDASSRQQWREAAEDARLDVPAWLVDSAPRPRRDKGASKTGPRPPRRTSESSESGRSVSELEGLHESAVRALQASGIRTIGQLAALTRKDLLGVQGIGQKWARDVNSALETLGLTLVTEPGRSLSPPAATTGGGDARPEPGRGSVTKVHPDGYGFLVSQSGEALYLPQRELKRLLPDLQVDDVLAYMDLRPGTKRREAVGLTRLVPDVVGMDLRAARGLLGRHRLVVEEDTGGRSIWVESNWYVSAQRPGALAAVPPDGVVIILLKNDG